MGRGSLDLAAELSRLSAATIFELRREWRRLHQTAAPMRLSRDLLMRGIAYKLQEKAHGGLSKSVARKLSKADAAMSGGARTTQAIALKPGTRLVREWRGVTHAVLILADGVEWRGQRCKSLSVVARAITGAHWSGPRFFGLRRRAARPDGDPAEADHADA